MREHRATRTLVKSAPELWLTCSEESLLGRHLEQFGEITITRLEPESTVAWEGEAASGTVQIEPSGWGTRVTLTAVAVSAETAGDTIETAGDTIETAGDRIEIAADVHTAPPEPIASHEPPEWTVPGELREQAASRDFWSRMVRRIRRSRRGGSHAAAAPADEPFPTPAPEPREPAPAAPESPEPALAAPERPEPVPAAPHAEVDEPQAEVGEPPFDLEAALSAALDSLGAAHHRPFSRS